MVHMGVICTIPSDSSDVHVESRMDADGCSRKKAGKSPEVSRSPGEAFTARKCNCVQCQCVACNDGTGKDITPIQHSVETSCVALYAL